MHAEKDYAQQGVQYGAPDKAPQERSLAEGVGFEPTRPVRAYRFSRPALSTAQPPLQDVIILTGRVSEDYINAICNNALHQLAVV
jgi:hypothetical protein